MDNISIQKATLDDLSDIQRLNQLLFAKEQREYDHKYNVNWPFEQDGIDYFTKELTSDDRIVFIAKDGEKTIGYLAASSRQSSKYENNMKIAELDNTLVLEEHRSQGVGKQLVDEFKKWANQIGAGRLYVSATYANEKGKSFYKKQGFTEASLEFQIDL